MGSLGGAWSVLAGSLTGQEMPVSLALLGIVQ